jgi:hypothetical protein
VVDISILGKNINNIYDFVAEIKKLGKNVDWRDEERWSEMGTRVNSISLGYSHSYDCQTDSRANDIPVGVHRANELLGWRSGDSAAQPFT